MKLNFTNVDDGLKICDKLCIDDIFNISNFLQSATALLNASLHDSDKTIRLLALDNYNLHPRAYVWSHMDENIVLR